MDAETPVFDYSFDSPWLLTDDILAAVDRAVEANESPADAYSRAVVDSLRTEPAAVREYRELFREAGVDLLSITLGVRTDPTLSFSERLWRDAARWQARFDSMDWLQKVTSPAHARSVVDDDGVGIVLNTQNLGAFVADDQSRIEALYDAGVRVFQLTYNRQNVLGTGCTDYSNGGLSARGRAAVEWIDDAEAVLDLSHCNRETTRDAIEHADGPAVFTHASCAAVADHARAKTDDELRAIAAADGYVGIVAIPSFLAPDRDDPQFEVFFDHLEHAASVVGVDRVGIGTDCLNLDVDVPEQLLDEVREFASNSLFREEHRATDGLGTGFGPFRSYTDWNVVRDGVHERFPPEEAAKILGGNFLDVWERSSN